MMDFINAHTGILASAAVMILDFLVNQLHPNPTVTSVINWILPFLRAKAT